MSQEGKGEKDKNKKEENPYIPKYISTVPWYYKNSDVDTKGDYLAHVRSHPNDGLIDHSVPQMGDSIKDEFEFKDTVAVKKAEGFDAKRDPWHGYDIEDWNQVFKNWLTIKNGDTLNSAEEEGTESDDTSFELELSELGLRKSDLTENPRTDRIAKTIHERSDVPSYIKNITTSGKIRYNPSTEKAYNRNETLFNNDDEFVPPSSVHNGDNKNIDGFAQKQANYYRNTQEKSINFDFSNSSLYSTEANPTASLVEDRIKKEQKKGRDAVTMEQLKKKYVS